MDEAAGSEDDSPRHVLSLPSDVLTTVLSMAALIDVRIVARFDATCRAAHMIVQDAVVREQLLCANELGSSNAPSLEGLAVRQAVLENIGALSWLVFQPGGAQLQPGEAPRLARAATILRRHTRAVLEIEAHAAGVAPTDIAESLAHSRASAVLRELLKCGAPREQLRARAWGRRLSASWPDEPTAARAEIYFELSGERFPHRPLEYDHASLPAQEVSASDCQPTPPPVDAHAGVSRAPDTTRRGLLLMVRQVRSEKEGGRTTGAPAPGSQRALRSTSRRRARRGSSWRAPRDLAAARHDQESWRFGIHMT